MKWKKAALALLIFVAIIYSGYYCLTRINLSSQYSVGDIVDSLDGVAVYHNGGVNHTEGRNLTPDGYNLGLKYQCVEFVKRYYYEYYNHRMPDSYGHAKSFFNNELKDGELNTQRDLLQYRNGGKEKPAKGDIIIFAPTIANPYGHVAIIADATDTSITVIQQNYGPLGSPRETFGLSQQQGKWIVDHPRVLGYLRKPILN